MALSMTGFGQAKLERSGVCLSVEIRTLNSKYLDLYLKLPKEFGDKEYEVRNLVTESLKRGKVSITLDYDASGEEKPLAKIDKNTFKRQYEDLQRLAKEVGDKGQGIFKIALDFPGVITEEENTNALISWEDTKKCILEAMEECNNFRRQEGQALENKLSSYCEAIQGSLQHIEDQDPLRMEKIRSRIKNNVREVLGLENVDQNRFEQEVIYYIEKLDISEEKVRLQNHLDYFASVLKNDQASGKKLGFISQEIGREINTIGSKANDSIIQKYVVEMKEELEKVKEQLLNLV